MELKRMKVSMFQFPGNSTLNCVGDESAMGRLEYYFNIHRGNDTTVYIGDFVQMLIENRVYCYYSSESVKSALLDKRCKEDLKKSGLWIDEAAFASALFYSNPRKASKALSISDDIMMELIKHSVWKDKFEVRL